MADETVTPCRDGVGVWDHYTLRDGLPDMKIESILEDRRGRLWIGTHDGGVACYDGARFAAYGRRDGLAGNGVFSILEDRAGDLWFGTDQGLTRYDGVTFRSVEHVGGRGAFLWGSCVDRSGNLWFGLEGRPGRPPAVCRWSGRRLELVELAPSGTVQGQSVHRIAVDAVGRIWFGGHGLYCLDMDGRICLVADTEKLGQVTAMIARHDGQVLVATERSLCSIRRNRDPEPLLHFTAGAWVESLVERDAKTLWVSEREGGLALYYPGAAMCRVQTGIAVCAHVLCAAGSGRLWFGTYGMGLYCYDTGRIRLYGVPEGLPATPVHALAADQSGHLWVGTSQGLARYDDQGLRTVAPEMDVETDGITALLVDRDNALWIGTRSSLLLCRSGQTTRLVHIAPEAEGFSLTGLAEGPEGAIWFCSRFGKGFGRYQGGQVVYFAPEEEGEYPAWVGALVVCQDGTVCLGSGSPTNWDGLCAFDGLGFKRLAGVSGASVRVLLEDRAGEVWVGTNEGLWRIGSGRTTRYTREDGLSCEIVTALAELTDGTLLIGTDGGGVCAFDGEVLQVVEISAEPAYGVIHAIVEDRRGRIWLGTEGGLVRYLPRRAGPHLELEVGIGKRTFPTSGPIAVPGTVERVSFRLRGKATAGRTPSLVYRYRLSGVDPGWHLTRTSAVEYEGLKPGSYRFFAQAVDTDLNYSSISSVDLVVADDPWIGLLGDDEYGAGDRASEGGAILLIDRDSAFTRRCVSALATHGYEVHVSDGPGTALQALEARSLELVILDLASAAGNEVELMARARCSKGKPEVMVLAEYASMSAAVRMAHRGALGYLAKPFERRQLLTEVPRILLLKRDPVLSYLRTRVGEVESRQQVAKLLRVSPGTLGNWVIKATGLSFSDFVSTCRLALARELLIATDLDAGQVATRIGVAAAGFARFFRRLDGRTPHQFRREMRASVPAFGHSFPPP
jgi:ligand-binding sensor domain-containing protein/AraC-like DNA-binding protein